MLDVYKYWPWSKEFDIVEINAVVAVKSFVEIVDVRVTIAFRFVVESVVAFINDVLSVVVDKKFIKPTLANKLSVETVESKPIFA